MRRNKVRGFGLVIAGMCFFANPMVAAVDVLPDWIGAFLVALGLSRMAAINRVVREARKAFFKVIGVDLLKDVLLFAVLGAGNPHETPTAVLTVAFGAGVLRLYFLLPAVTALFEGILSMAMAAESPAFYIPRRGVRSYPEVIGRATAVFFAVREALCVLPELSSLTTNTYIDSEAINLYNYIGVMRGFAAVVAMVFAVVWLVRVLVFFRRLSHDAALNAGIGNAFAAYRAAHPQGAALTYHAVGLVLLSIGGLLLADFYLDYYNVFPDWLGAVFLVCGIALLRLPWKVRLPALIAAVVYGVTAAFSSHFSYKFEANYSSRVVLREVAAANAYRASWLSALAEFFVFLVFFALLLLLLRRLVDVWGVYRPKDDTAFEERARARIREETDGQWIKCYVFGFLSALASFFYDFLQGVPYGEKWRFLAFFWLADLSLGVVAGVIFAVTLSRVFELLQKKFELD